VGAIVLARVGAWQQNPLPEKTGPLRKAMLLLREGKTAEARKDLEEQRRQRPEDAEVLYQIARSYLLDFYRMQNAEQGPLCRTPSMPARAEMSSKASGAKVVSGQSAPGRTKSSTQMPVQRKSNFSRA
jgi:hypothetical protein